MDKAIHPNPTDHPAGTQAIVQLFDHPPVDSTIHGWDENRVRLRDPGKPGRPTLIHLLFPEHVKILEITKHAPPLQEGMIHPNPHDHPKGTMMIVCIVKEGINIGYLAMMDDWLDGGDKMSLDVITPGIPRRLSFLAEEIEVLKTISVPEKVKQPEKVLINQQDHPVGTKMMIKLNDSPPGKSYYTVVAEWNGTMVRLKEFYESDFPALIWFSSFEVQVLEVKPKAESFSYTPPYARVQAKEGTKPVSDLQQDDKIVPLSDFIDWDNVVYPNSNDHPVGTEMQVRIWKDNIKGRALAVVRSWNTHDVTLNILFDGENEVRKLTICDKGVHVLKVTYTPPSIMHPNDKIEEVKAPEITDFQGKIHISNVTYTPPKTFDPDNHKEGDWIKASIEADDPEFRIEIQWFKILTISLENKMVKLGYANHNQLVSVVESRRILVYEYSDSTPFEAVVDAHTYEEKETRTTVSGDLRGISSYLDTPIESPPPLSRIAHRIHPWTHPVDHEFTAICVQSTHLEIFPAKIITINTNTAYILNRDTGTCHGYSVEIVYDYQRS